MWKVYTTEDVLIQDEFGNDAVIHQGKLHEIYVDEQRPNWVLGQIHHTLVSDEASFVQWGQSLERDLYTYSTKPPYISGWNYYPTPEDPTTKFKFSSFEITFGPELTVINRQTYMLLDWLGDLGGLLDALYLICAAILAPV